MRVLERRSRRGTMWGTNRVVARACSAAMTDEPRGLTAAQLMTVEQLAERWQVDASHVYRLTRHGALPVVRLGRYYRFRLAAIEEFEQAGGTRPDHQPRREGT